MRLRITDEHNVSDDAIVVVSAGNSAPTAVIDTPTSSTTWAVGEGMTFSGHADDPEDGALPASALTWTLTLQHCPSACHAHPLQSFNGVAGGSFIAADHEYPSHLVLALTATDSRGVKHTTSVELQPRTATITLASDPAGLILTAGGQSAPAPFETIAIEGASVSVSAPSSQELRGTTYAFSGWSNGGARAHTVVVSAPITLTATYVTPGAP